MGGSGKPGDLKKVRNLQKLMLRSSSAALVSVRRVTEVNAGRRTAGVDGRVVTDSRGKAAMAAWLQHGAAAHRQGRCGGCMCPRATGAVAGSAFP
jgi:RNA-directed DNA polymerase